MFRGYAVVLVSMSMTTAAHAYLDPGAGSFLLQMIAAGLLAAGVSLKVFWYKIIQVLQTVTKGLGRQGN